jgi:hypothetical protein
MVAKSNRIPEASQTKMMGLIEQEQSALMSLNGATRQLKQIQADLSLLNQVTDPKDERAGPLRQEMAFVANTIAHWQMKHRALSDLNTTLRTFLERLPVDVSIVERKPARFKLEPGEDFKAAVDRVQDEIKRLKSEKIKVQRSGLTKKERKAAVLLWIEKQGRRGSPSVRWNDGGQPSIAFDVNVEDAYTPIRDVGAMFCWLAPDLMKAKLFEMIDAVPDQHLSMSKEKKEERLVELDREIFTLGLEEEAIIEAAAARESHLLRRGDADARCVLGLRIMQAKTPAKSKAA